MLNSWKRTSPLSSLKRTISSILMLYPNLITERPSFTLVCIVDKLRCFQNTNLFQIQELNS